MPSDSQHSIKALRLALFLTVSISMIKGGAPAWVSLLWSGLCFIGLCIVLVLKKRTTEAGQNSKNNHQGGRVNPLFILLLFQLWAAIQYGTIAPDKAASLNSVLVGFAMLSLLTIWKSALTHSNSLKILFSTIVLCSCVQCVYGLWVYLSGVDMLLWMPKLHYLDRPTGFFVNANHFAAYIALTIILTISYTLTNKPSGKSKALFIRVFDYFYNPAFLTLLLLLIGLIASKSIGALAALFTVSCLILMRVIWRLRQRAVLFSAISILGIATLLAILSLDYALIEQEISGLSHTFSRRYALSHAALRMLEDTWLVGIGGGSFYSQFSPYRSLEIGNAYYYYAHNDLIQFWIEYGLVGVSLLALFLSGVLRDNIRVLKQPHTHIQATFAYTSLYGTVAVAIHSLVDFPMHIPGFSVLYLVIVSVNSLHLKPHPAI